MPNSAECICLERMPLTRVRHVASVIAAECQAGDVVCLSGPLAAGKTTFVQAMAARLGISDTVASPTFGLVHIYNGSGLTMQHVDAYRIESETAFVDLALDDFYPAHLTVIEWADRFPDVIPDGLSVALAPDGADTRTIAIRPTTRDWSERLSRLAPALCGSQG